MQQWLSKTFLATHEIITFKQEEVSDRDEKGCFTIKALGFYSPPVCTSSFSPEYLNVTKHKEGLTKRNKTIEHDIG